MEIKVFEGKNPNVKKYVFTKEDAVYETVIYKYGSYDKRTVICCSVQSGCPVGCTFCGTGKRFIRNLTQGEIIEQITSVLEKENITNPFNIEEFQIMFMSMGEPLLNINPVHRAIKELNKIYPNAQLLLSTMGIQDECALSELIVFSEEISQVGLQFSLHNSIDEERDKIIPFKNKMTIRQLRNFGMFWHKRTGRKPYINYCVTEFNSSEQHINRILDLFPPNIFCITFSVVCNSDKNSDVDETDYTNLQKMQSVFIENGYKVKVFDPAGKDDIGGGCGQLWYVQDWLKGFSRNDMVCCEQIRKMKHALGIGNAKEYHRHGKKYIKSYRNYYQVNNPDTKWEELVEFGMAEKEIVNDKYIYYSVTDRGIEFMNKQLQAIIKESD